MAANDANAAPNIPFALTPAEVDDEVLDYRTTEGKKLYKAATTPLATKFDGDSEKISLFLRDVAQHAEENNWDPILQIPNDANVARNLLTSYGELTEANIRTHAMTYITASNRNTQRSAQMYHFLYYSIEADLRVRITNEETRYTIVHNNRTYRDGPLFLKAVTTLVCVDTASTIAGVHAQLHTLDTYMRTKVENCDIDKFNTHVRNLRMQLENRAETLTNTQLNVHLFRGYAACSDPEFVSFISTIQNQVLYQNAVHTPDEIMTLALRFFTDRTRNGLWNKPSPEKEQILALTAELKNLRSKGHERGGKRDKNKKDGKNRRDKKNKKRVPKWKTTPPKDGESTTKKIKGKTFYWCPAHQEWVNHRPEDCKGIGTPQKGQQPADEKGGDQPKKPAFTPKPPNKRLQFQRALNAIVEASDDEDDDE